MIYGSFASLSRIQKLMCWLTMRSPNWTNSIFIKQMRSAYVRKFQVWCGINPGNHQIIYTKSQGEKIREKLLPYLHQPLLNTTALSDGVFTLANKAYLLAMHKSWATENKAFNITSNCISPDFMTTALNDQTDERVIENLVKTTSFKKNCLQWRKLRRWFYFCAILLPS